MYSTSKQHSWNCLYCSLEYELDVNRWVREPLGTQVFQQNSTVYHILQILYQLRIVCSTFCDTSSLNIVGRASWGKLNGNSQLDAGIVFQQWHATLNTEISSHNKASKMYVKSLITGKKRKGNKITRIGRGLGCGGSFEICDLNIAHFAYKLRHYRPRFHRFFLSFSVPILFLLRDTKLRSRLAREKVILLAATSPSLCYSLESVNKIWSNINVLFGLIPLNSKKRTNFCQLSRASFVYLKMIKVLFCY